MVALLAGPVPGPHVLDTCASPGGKTTELAAMMHNGGAIVACDVRPRRIELLRHTVAVSGATNIAIVQADLLEPLPFSRPFDTVLVDAPCSGLGTLRRDPDIRWRRQEADLLGLANAQLRMLGHAATVVAPEGRLVYATCSSEPEENDDVVGRFLAARPEFEAVDARELSPGLPASVVDGQGHLKTEPDTHGLEGFFGAVFRRRSQT